MVTKAVPLDQARRAVLRTALGWVGTFVVVEQTPVLCPRSDEGHTFSSERVLRAEERPRNAKSKVTPAKFQAHCEYIFGEY
jgi:hypothetical protein